MSGICPEPPPGPGDSLARRLGVPSPLQAPQPVARVAAAPAGDWHGPLLELPPKWGGQPETPALAPEGGDAVSTSPRVVTTMVATVAPGRWYAEVRMGGEVIEILGSTPEGSATSYGSVEEWMTVNPPPAPAPDPIEVPADGARIVRTGCEGGVLVIAFAPGADPERIVKIADDVYEESGLKVIALADVAAVKAWHPHDAPSPEAATPQDPVAATVAALVKLAHDRHASAMLAKGQRSLERGYQLEGEAIGLAEGSREVRERLARAWDALAAERDQLRENVAECDEVIADLERERDALAARLASTQAHRDRLNRELAALTRELNAKDAELAETHATGEDWAKRAAGALQERDSARDAGAEMLAYIEADEHRAPGITIPVTLAAWREALKEAPGA